MKRTIVTEGAPRAIGPYSQAVQADGLVFISGQIGLDPSSGRLVGPGVGEQAERCLSNLEAVLAAAGLSLSNVVKTTVFLTDMSEFKEVNEVYASRFTSDPPARSTVAVSALPLGARVEIEALAVRDQTPGWGSERYASRHSGEHK
jgi:2-iminobutanoate/2-iminopropanoate deaminase